MRSFVEDSKLSTATVQRKIDLRPWLESIASGYFKHQLSVPEGLTCTARRNGDTLQLAASGGSLGTGYDIGLTVTAQSGATRLWTWRVTNLGVAPSSGSISVIDSISGSASNSAPSQRAVRAAVTSLQSQIDSLAASGFVVAPDLSTPSTTTPPSVTATKNAIDAASLAAAQATTALAGVVQTKADTTAVTAGLALKADQAAMTTALAGKADQSSMTTALAAKASVSSLTTGLAAKLDVTTSTQLLAGKQPFDGPGEFRNSKLRGMGVDGFVADSPRSAEWWSVFSLFNCNVSRIFVSVKAASRGAPYVIAPAHLNSLMSDVASAQAIGCRMVIVLAPETVGGSSAGDRRDENFWGSAAARAQFVTVWGILAQQFVGNESVIFDIINEPHNPASQGQAGADDILLLQEQCIAEIRKYDQRRICMVEPAADGSPWGYLWMRPVADRNTVYSVHVYQPFNITHARVAAPAYTGTYPSTTGMVGDLPYLRSAVRFTKERILVELDPVIKFAQKHGVAIFVGEFSVSRLTPHPIAPNLLADYIATFEALGWSWSYHSFGFPSNPWSPMELPSSSALIDSQTGQVALNSVTGCSNGEGYAPIAPLSAAMEKNALFRTAPVPAVPTFACEEDFELAATGGWFTQRNGAGGGGTIDTGATVHPDTGTKHCRIQHNNTSDAVAARMLLQPEVITSAAARAFFLSFRIALITPPVATKDIQILEINQDGGGSGAFMSLRNVTGTNTWVLEVYDGVPAHYATRPRILIDGFSLPADGSYTSVKVAWLCRTVYGRVQVWQGPTDATRKKLLDAVLQTTANDTTDYTWCPYLGYVGTQRNLILDIDNIKYSKHADAT